MRAMVSRLRLIRLFVIVVATHCIWVSDAWGECCQGCPLLGLASLCDGQPSLPPPESYLDQPGISKQPSLTSQLLFAPPQQTQCSACNNPNCPRRCLSYGNLNATALPLDRYKQSFFQLWETEAAWIGSDDELATTEVNSFLRVAIPLDGTPDNIIALQPGLRTYFLEGPTIVDVPAALYDAQVSIVWRKKFSERWQTNVWLQPKIRSDFQTSDDAFFFSGGAYAKYVWTPNVFDLYLGAFYLDRDDVSVLPAVGFVWSPTPDWRYEVLLPRPKIAHRLTRIGDCFEKWAYLSGQLGGGSFAVERVTGETDKLTLRDLRIFWGIETVRPGGAGTFAEVGYVFNRGVQYKNNDEEYEFDGSLMLRLGMRF